MNKTTVTKEFTYDDGFEDGVNTKEQEILNMLNSLLINCLTDDSLDAYTIKTIIEKIKDL